MYIESIAMLTQSNYVFQSSRRDVGKVLVHYKLSAMLIVLGSVFAESLV